MYISVELICTCIALNRLDRPSPRDVNVEYSRTQNEIGRAQVLLKCRVQFGQNLFIVKVRSSGCLSLTVSSLRMILILELVHSILLGRL